MAIFRLKGEVTPARKLVIQLPDDVPTGDVEVIISATEPEASDDETFTDEELADLFTYIPTSGADAIAQGLTGVWEDMGIEDSVAWVEEQRRKQREKRKW